MKFRKGYKYQLAEDWVTPLHNQFLPDFEHPYFSIRDGFLTAHKGYAWDGASGPTIDNDPKTAAPSLFHDICYQLMRLRVIPKEELDDFRKDSDEEFYNMLRRRGFWWFRAKYWFYGLRKFGSRDGGRVKEIIEVP